jgi:hypothetical protein
VSPDRGPRLATEPAARAAPRARGRRSAALAACVVLAAVAPHARAHDFWIEPSTFRPATGSPVTFRLRVGERLAGEALARDDSMVVRFVAAGPRGEVPVAGADGAEPAGIATLPVPGRWVVAYQGRPSAVELEPAKFAGYLAAEGLERIIDLRRARGEERRSARELYSRCAKALLVVGDAPDAPLGDGAASAPLGLTLELVPLPRAAGGDFAFRLLYEGRPLAGALVAALSERAPTAPVAARTDHDGRVALPLTAPGWWLVKAVHMIDAAPGSGADYESFWASLAFALPGSP